MASVCSMCDEELENDDEIVCDGVCGKKFHFNKCLKLTKTKLKFITEDKNVKWFCIECVSVIDSIFIKMNTILSVLNKHDDKFSKQEELLNEMKNTVTDMKTKMNSSDIEIKKAIKTVSDKKSETNLSFSEILKTKINDPVVILRPKSENQTSEITKNEVKKTINPVNLEISSFRSGPKGAVVIGCKSTEDRDKLKKDAENKLGEKYEINIPQLKNPRLKIFGLSEKYESAQLIGLIRKQNHEINDTAIIEVRKNEKVKNRNIFVAVLEVDAETFRKLMSVGKINIGWDRCPVFEDISVDRCFKCEGYFHKSAKCTNKVACPICAGEHLLKDCKSKTRCCINCVKANENLKLSLNTSHAAWSRDCSVLIRKMDSEQKRINYSEK
jgi:hypothetical protein